MAMIWLQSQQYHRCRHHWPMTQGPPANSHLNRIDLNLQATTTSPPPHLSIGQICKNWLLWEPCVWVISRQEQTFELIWNLKSILSTAILCVLSWGNLSRTQGNNIDLSMFEMLKSITSVVSLFENSRSTIPPCLQTEGWTSFETNKKYIGSTVSGILGFWNLLQPSGAHI